MNLSNLKKIFESYGCTKLYVKKLASNDNSKNQVYFGGDFNSLNIFPIKSIVGEDAGEWKKERFKAAIQFGWIQDDGQYFPVPNAQLILYPKYPEVRFSGFLKGCQMPPSGLMVTRESNRTLFLGISVRGIVLGYVSGSKSELSKEFDELTNLLSEGVFKIIELGISINSKELLLNELRRIHEKQWIQSKRLDRNHNILPCLSPNCGGYTLEAELDITPNGYSEPDFHGWEVKQFGVKKFTHLNSAVITLMTPEPTGGLYTQEGVKVFIEKYGYSDKRGRADRMNFGGIHKHQIRHATTNLTLTLQGFDKEKSLIRNSNGIIALIDHNENIAASWDFPSLLLHWNRKHNKACYVPSLSSKDPFQKYSYGDKVIICESTDFQLFLNAIAYNFIYYDPGIKIEDVSTNPKIKRRSQFRIISKNISKLYGTSELIGIN